MKNIFRITVLLLALVLCIGMFVSCDKGVSLKSVEKDPYAALADANQKYLDALTEKYGKEFKVFDTIAEGTGSHTLSLSVPEIADASINVVADAKTGAYNGSITVGSQGISAEAKLWGDKNNIALSLPALLGDGNYGVKLDTFETDIKTSPILEAMGVSYDDLIAGLEDEMGISFDDLKGVLNIETIKTSYEKYVSDTDAIFKGLTATVAEETVGETAVITIQYTITKETAEKMMNAATEMYSTMFDGLFKAAGTDADEITDELTSALDEFGADATVKYYIVKETGVILKMEMVKGEEMNMTFNYSQDLSKPLDMTIDMDMTIDDMSYDIDLTFKEPTDEGLGGIYADAKINASYDGETEEYTAGISFITDDATGAYDIEVIADGQTVAMATGTLTYSDSEFSVSVDSITVDEETVKMDLSYSAKAEGTVEAVPEYSNIITMPVEDLQTLIMNISSSDLGSLFMMGGYEESYEEEFDGYYGEDFDDYYGEDFDDYYSEDFDDYYGEDFEWDTDDWYFETEDAEVIG